MSRSRQPVQLPQWGLRGGYEPAREGLYMIPVNGLGEATPAPKRARAAKGSARTCVQGEDWDSMAVEICATWRGHPQSESIRSSRDIADRVLRFVNPDAMVREHLGVLILDAKNRPIGYYIAALGTLTGAASNPQTVLRPVMILPAAGFVLVHNHPTGVTSPSATDVAFTRDMKTAAELCGTRLIDHLILGRNGEYMSFLDQGLL